MDIAEYISYAIRKCKLEVDSPRLPNVTPCCHLQISLHAMFLFFATLIKIV